MECTICSGPAYVLGILGNRAHYRCRNCRIEFSRPTKDAYGWPVPLYDEPDDEPVLPLDGE